MAPLVGTRWDKPGRDGFAAADEVEASAVESLAAALRVAGSAGLSIADRTRAQLEGPLPVLQ